MTNSVKELRDLARAAGDFGDFARQDILDTAANELEAALADVEIQDRLRLEAISEIERLRAVLPTGDSRE